MSEPVCGYVLGLAMGSLRCQFSKGHGGLHSWEPACPECGGRPGPGNPRDLCDMHYKSFRMGRPTPPTPERCPECGGAADHRHDHDSRCPDGCVGCIVPTEPEGGWAGENGGTSGQADRRGHGGVHAR